ncbi:hypothetical protein M153_3998000139 [Pseudoloma neurophilia]|uniref:N-acetyltransferase domain-containing protein n=1 Tax=Pseudoloma neurophilia TaxID=146866 RepID=A0A0R0LTJ2_9MICR|nr:hypothetical protein M153_3998000139 [Pseudoloma neurophilia]
MLLTLLFFNPFSNSFAHLSQVEFAYEAKVALNINKEIFKEKVAMFNNFSNIYHLRIENNNLEKNLGSENVTMKSRFHHTYRINSKKGGLKTSDLITDSPVLTSNASIVPEIYHGDGKFFQILEIYSIYTKPFFRNIGLAKQIFFGAIGHAINQHGYSNPILILHLNTKDPLMHVAFSFYLNMGFHTLTYVKSGPSDMKYSFSSKDRQKFFNFKEVEGRPVENKHLCMMAMNGIDNSVRGDFTEIGKRMIKRIDQWIFENTDKLETDSEESNE